MVFITYKKLDISRLKNKKVLFSHFSFDFKVPILRKENLKTMLLKREKMFWFNKWKQEGRTRDDSNYVRCKMKSSKKVFVKRLRFISRQYEENAISQAAMSAEVDRNKFWRIFKNTTKPGKSKLMQ